MTIPTEVHIFTDGSSQFNGTPECIGGWALVIPNFKGKMLIRYGNLPAPSSNNKAEIAGVLYALHLFHKSPRFKLVISSDSQYTVKSCNEWRHKWKHSDYDGIKNTKLLVPLFNYIDACEVTPVIQWVKGHANCRGNQLADEFCGLGRREIIREKIDDVSDIRYIPHTTLSQYWDLTHE